MLRAPEKRLDKVVVWKQRFHQRLTYQEIATLHGVSPQAVHQACQALEQILPDPDSAKAYDSVRAEMLNAVEHQLVASLVEPARLAKASLNNVAYAFQQVHTARRLETGQSTSNLAVLSKLIESANGTLNAKPVRSIPSQDAESPVAMQKSTDPT